MAMRIFLNPSAPRVWRISYESAEHGEYPETDIEADYWQEALAFYWTGQDAVAFAELQDVEVSQCGTISGILTIWIDAGGGNWDQCLIQDVTNMVRPQDDYLSCEKVSKLKRAKHERRKQRH